ncbi:AzlD domain-containing protein [Anaerosolibacter sp.]|uniref:AzlD domain-containing protein n=1 Tax=Anaerosolibacter sp. TaxID=1872527 RepID=UPI0039EECD4E
MNDMLVLIVGMTAVTYLPRVIPFFIVSQTKLSKRIQRFLQFIPYAALGALIIPGAFSATPDMPSAAMVGILFAGLYGWFRGGIIIPVLGSIIATWMILSSGFGMIM